jgi:hypothetical protein
MRGTDGIDRKPARYYSNLGRRLISPRFVTLGGEIITGKPCAELHRCARLAVRFVASDWCDRQLIGRNIE